MDYWIDIDVYGIDGFDVRLSYSYEDIPIRDMFDNEYDNIEEMEEKVNNYDAYWIIGRIQLFKGYVEVAESTLGGIYIESLDELKEYYSYDMLLDAYDQAVKWIKENREFFNSIEE